MEKLVEKKLLDFFSNHKKIHFEKGETLIQAGTDPGGIYLLTEGVVRCFAISAAGQEVTINSFKPVSFFPIGQALNESTNSYFYQAYTDIETFKAPSDEVVKFLKNEPEVVFDLLKRIYRGLEGYMQRLEKLADGTAYERLLNELLIMGRRFGSGKADLEIPFKVTESDLAAQTGLTRETISRLLAQLKEEGLVLINHRTITLTDLTKLEEKLGL